MRFLRERFLRARGEINFQSEIDEDESSCQRKRKKTQECAVDEPKKIEVSKNKRRKLEKLLYAKERHQVMVKVAKEEF